MNGTGFVVSLSVSSWTASRPLEARCGGSMFDSRGALPAGIDYILWNKILDDFSFCSRMICFELWHEFGTCSASDVVDCGSVRPDRTSLLWVRLLGRDMLEFMRVWNTFSLHETRVI